MLGGESCRGWEGRGPLPDGVKCPPIVAYPEPPHPIETLFLSWNPPGAKHFWNSPQDDLRRELSKVLWELGWNRQGDFIEQFLSRRCYLVHAVRCWTNPKFPGGELGNRFASVCARALLAPTLEELKPKRICALGRVPHIALHAVLKGVPKPSAGFRYSEGWHGTAGPYEIIITCFPNTWPVEKQNSKGRKNRDCTVAALRKWWNPSGTPDLEVRSLRKLRYTARELRELLDQRLTVRHIAEFQLIEAGPEEDGLSLQKSMLEKDIDVVPVRRNGKVRGYVVWDQLRGGPCGDQELPLGPDNLLAESTPLLEVLRVLRDRPWRFVLDRDEVAGIVTRGDLRKAPVRMFIFSLVNLLEMYLNRLIRHNWHGDTWRQHLKRGRIASAKGLLSQRKARNEAVDLVDCLQFCDKRDIAVVSPSILELLGFPSKASADRVLRNAEALRDRLAHAQDMTEGISWAELFDIAEQVEKMLLRCEEAAVGTQRMGGGGGSERC